jgi:hypothetical protein
VLGNSRKDGSASAVIGIVAIGAPAICANWLSMMVRFGLLWWLVELV